MLIKIDSKAIIINLNWLIPISALWQKMTSVSNNKGQIL